MNKDLILIVNDDPNSCKLFKIYAVRAGYDALSTDSAEQALTLLPTVHPVMIISDIQLPGMDGVAFLRRLKAAPATRDIPVIVTSVYYERYSQQYVMEAGANGYIIVPAEREQFMELVENTIRAVFEKHRSIGE
jgi:CheY-like chemotaxis protein